MSKIVLSNITKPETMKPVEELNVDTLTSKDLGWDDLKTIWVLESLYNGKGSVYFSTLENAKEFVDQLSK